MSTDDTTTRAAEIIHAQVHYDTPPEVTSCGVCHDAVDSLMGHGALVTPAHDAAVIEKFLRERDTPSVRIENPEAITPLLARAWGEGFKQGGPMHDVHLDDPDAHTRNPYREDEGDDGPDLLAALVRSVEKARESRRHEGETDE